MTGLSGKKTARKAPKKAVLPTTLRDHFEALTMAILLAVGLKYFLIEAYEIPTPSMQPTMMGSDSSGIHDRILVDKAAYLLREPRRWEVAIFRYPLNRSQNYVKRIVGLPGEHLKILGGDIYKILASPDGGQARFECLLKPGPIQDRLWRTVYDSGGTHLQTKDLGLDNSSGLWKLAGLDLTAEDTGSGAHIRFLPLEPFYNRYWHGYPDEILEAMKEERPSSVKLRPVGDLRWTLTLLPDAEVGLVRLEHKERYTRMGFRRLRLSLERSGPDRARALLELAHFRGSESLLLGMEKRELGEVPFTEGEPLELRLVKLDGRVGARVGGRDLDPIPIRWKGEPLQVVQVELFLSAEGARETRFRGFKVERDIYYTGSAENDQNVSEVRIPPDHYWMLGDNSQNSADGRAWKEFTIRVGEEGRILPFHQAGGRLLSGGDRYRPDNPEVIDPDENPVVVPWRSRDEALMVVTDIQGEEHVVRATTAEFEGHRRVRESLFVHRKYVIGRALLTFWPAIPWGPFRVGLIR